MPCESVQGITVWYHPELRIAQGYTSIHLVVKSFLGLVSWLELDGAAGYTVLPPTEI